MSAIRPHPLPYGPQQQKEHREAMEKRGIVYRSRKGEPMEDHTKECLGGCGRKLHHRNRFCWACRMDGKQYDTEQAA